MFLIESDKDDDTGQKAFTVCHVIWSYDYIIDFTCSPESVNIIQQSLKSIIFLFKNKI